MPIDLIAKIAPKNAAFTGMVDADQVVGGGDAGTLPNACISAGNVSQHDCASPDVNHNVTTNLSISGTTTTKTITCSDGTDAIIPVATTSVSGVMSKAIFDEHTANNAKDSNKYTTSAYSATLIKVLPPEFRSNDDRGNDQYVCIEDGVDGDDTPIGAICGHSVVEAYAFVKIPSGFKATHVEVHASASTSRAVEAWDYNYTDGERVQVYTGGAGQFDFNANTTLSTEVVSSTTKDLLIKVMPADNSTLLFGATVTIVAV